MTEYPRRTCAAVLLRPLFERLTYHQRSLSFLHSFFTQAWLCRTRSKGGQPTPESMSGSGRLLIARTNRYQLLGLPVRVDA